MGNPQVLKANNIALFFLPLMAGMVVFSPEVLAQSSLGIGRSEQVIQPTGPFAGFFLWVQQQKAFYNEMRIALQSIREDGSGVWLLAGLSFLYGVLHAVGPGHGKAVVSSYMLANEVAARRGIYLSFASALLQGITAITIIGSIVLVLRGTGIKSDDLAGFLEISSYFLVMMLGAYLLWTKLLRKNHYHHEHDHSHNHHSHNHTHSHAHEHVHVQAHGHQLAFAHAHGSSHDHGHSHVHISHSHTCDSCGHSHAPDPTTLEGKFGGREAISAIFAVGLRPCTGAIIVLTFAFLNGMYLVGIFSTLAMSIGTGITVAVLALLAVTAKNTALQIAGWQDKAGTLHRLIEITGAAFVFLLGLLLFTASLSV